MARIDYLNDANAPRANSIVPAASAIVRNGEQKILLHKRSDNGLWALPGGSMEIGENIGQTAIREVKEETGLDVVIEFLVGIYSDPGRVIAFSNGEVRQEFSVCFACKIVGGELHVSKESFTLLFFTPEEIEQLAMHESIRLRIKHFLENGSSPIIG